MDSPSPQRPKTPPAGCAGKTLAFREVVQGSKRFLVLIHGAAEPDAAEWQAYLLQVDALLSGSTQLVHAFVATDGGGPNAPQRKALADVLDGRQSSLMTHVFTTDRLVRGIVTAFRWIARARAVAHLPSEFPSVCFEAGLRTEDVARALSLVQESFPKVRTLGLMLDSTRTTRRHSAPR